MRSLEIDSQTTLAHILGELKITEEDGLELTAVPGEKTILDNEINLKIIKKTASEFKKEVVFPDSPIEKAPEIVDDNLGFVEGEDIVSKAPMEEVKNIIEPAAAVSSVPMPKFNKNKFLLPLKNKWFLLAGGLGLVLLLLAGLFIYLPSATVKLKISAESKEAQISLTADPKVKEVSVKDKVVPYTTSSVSKQSEDETTATGKKKIGTPAKGRITIYNQDTDNSKSFLAGTLITPVATSSVTFKTTDAVDLDKAPVGSQTVKDVNVTALAVGPDGNLAANTVFKVGSASTTFVFAKNNLAFSEGTVKDAVVVSQADRDGLKDKIVAKISKDAEKELMKKISGSLIPEGALETKVVSETYTPKDVNAEGDKLTANIELQTSAPLIKEDDLKEVLLGALEKNITEGLKIDEEQITVSSQLVDKGSDGKFSLLGKIKAKLVPEVTTAEIRKHVRGQSVGSVQNYLAGLKGVSEYEVDINPFFIRIFRIMPFLGNRINIVVSK